MPYFKIKTGLGQDSHKFIANKPLILGGVKIPYHLGLEANSDGDVILHSITNALSSITGQNILGEIANNMHKQGITDSTKYLNKVLDYLKDFSISHIAISIEAKEPKISPHIKAIKKNIAKLLNISAYDVGITATSGEGLSDFGRGLGIQSIAIITVTSHNTLKT